MTADFLKMPDPIMLPTTIITVLNRPSVGTSPVLTERDWSGLPGEEVFGLSTFKAPQDKCGKTASSRN
jgi:hypothetical protein